MLKLAVVSLLSSKALSAIDDSSALIQQRREDFDHDDFQLTGNVCTQQDYDHYAAALEAFKKKEQAKEQAKELKRAAKEKEKSDAAEAAAREKEAAFLAFLKPMLDKVEMVGKYLEVEAQPTGLLVVKSLLQLPFKGPLVGPEVAVDGNKTVQEFLKRWDREILVHVKSLLQDGFEALHKDVEKAFLDLDPVLQAHAYNATYPVHGETELQAYILAKVLPVAAVKTFPMLEDVAKVLVTMPTNASEQGAWALKQVLPVLTKNLPPTCQPARLFTTLGLGSGDVVARIGKFIEVCEKGLGMDHNDHNDHNGHEEPEASPPTRKCSTCAELYHKQASDMSDPNGCMMHCTPVALSCFQGVTDGCVHKFHPCLRCHKRKLAALDTCLGDTTHANMIDIIGKLSTITKTATVEQGGAKAFMDSFIDAFKVL